MVGPDGAEFAASEFDNGFRELLKALELRFRGFQFCSEIEGNPSPFTQQKRRLWPQDIST
jgi:hypothetical protein